MPELHLNTRIENAQINGIHLMKTPIVAQQGQKPSDVYKMMNNNSIHHIPIVVDNMNNRLVGIVSSTDFLKAMYNNIDRHQNLIYLDETYKTIMDMVLGQDKNKKDNDKKQYGEEYKGFYQNMVQSYIDKITTINKTDSVHEAAEKLTTGNFHSLPVVDDQGNIVGIVTSTDLVQCLEETRICHPYRRRNP